MHLAVTFLTLFCCMSSKLSNKKEKQQSWSFLKWLLNCFFLRCLQEGSILTYLGFSLWLVLKAGHFCNGQPLVVFYGSCPLASLFLLLEQAHNCHWDTWPQVYCNLGKGADSSDHTHSNIVCLFAFILTFFLFLFDCLLLQILQLVNYYAQLDAANLRTWNVFFFLILTFFSFPLTCQRWHY